MLGDPGRLSWAWLEAPSLGFNGATPSSTWSSRAICDTTVVSPSLCQAAPQPTDIPGSPRMDQLLVGTNIPYLWLRRWGCCWAAALCSYPDTARDLCLLQ